MGQELVDRATSDTLIAPDWVLNGEICNDINQDARLVKDVVKALKKRIGHKNPKVQILALSLLESMIKECGEVVHAYVAEREVLKEMVKIAKKKPDPRVKQKILLLVETWQEVFGGPLGMYPQYYAAYQELLNSGFLFPEEKISTALVVHQLYQQTLPLQNHPVSEHTEYHDKDSLSPTRSKDTSRVMSLSDFKDACDVMDMLSEMLNDLGSRNKEGLNQEVMVNLVCQCRTNKERVAKLLNSTTDEYIISKAAALNDGLENVLARYKAIIAEPIVIEKYSISPKQENNSVEDETRNEVNSSRSVASTSKDDKPPSQQLAPPDTCPESTATPPAPAKVEEPLIDFLSGDDFFQPKSDETALAIVLYEPNHTASSQQVSPVTDMFADLLSGDPNENYRLTSNTGQNPTTLPSVQPRVYANRNLPDQHLPDIIPWHVEPTVHANRNLPDQHLPENMPWNVEAAVPANRYSPDQHLPKAVLLHEEPIVHVNRNSPDQLQPENMTWHLEPTYYANGGNLNLMAGINHDSQFQMNIASNQWNHTIGTSDHNESLPPPPWESQASDVNPFYDNQMGFQTTYPTQQSQMYPTQLPQQYLTPQPQPYPTQQHQLYPTQQHQPYLTQLPQQKQVKQNGFVSMMSQQIAIGQDRSLQPMEIPINSPYSQVQNTSLTNQQPMYAAQTDPYYNQNMYTYEALNQENLSIYNSQMPTSMVQQPNKFQNLWSGGAF